MIWEIEPTFETLLEWIASISIETTAGSIVVDSLTRSRFTANLSITDGDALVSPHIAVAIIRTVVIDATFSDHHCRFKKKKKKRKKELEIE